MSREDESINSTIINLSKILQKRIMITVYAYSYEMKHDSLIDDYYYDNLALEVNKDKNVITGDTIYDKFFREQFDPNTGMWIRKHPDLNNGKIERVYQLIKKYE